MSKVKRRIRTRLILMIPKRTGASAKISNVTKKPEYKVTNKIPGIVVQTCLTKEQIKKMGELSDNVIKDAQKRHKLDSSATRAEIVSIMINAVRILEDKKASNAVDAVKKAKEKYLNEQKKTN